MLIRTNQLLTLVLLSLQGDTHSISCQKELILKWMSSSQRLMVFLVSLVSFLAKYLTSFLIVASLLDGYMLIVSNDAIVTSYLFTSNSSSLSFRSESWTIKYCEWVTFPLSRHIFTPRYPILKKVAVKLVAGITNLVGN